MQKLCLPEDCDTRRAKRKCGRTWPRNGIGYPLPIYPRVKTPLGCWFGRFCPPTGVLLGDYLTHWVKRVQVHFLVPHTHHPMGPPSEDDK
jgi:hypothetical protein